MTAPSRPRVVVIGGGFAGLNVAKTVANRPVDVVLIDRNNHHLFQPILYQVATAALGPEQIATPIRSVLRDARNIDVVLGEVIGVDLATKAVRLSDGSRVEYDYVVIATGARHSYFGKPEWESLAPGLKSLEDALEIFHRGAAAKRSPASVSSVPTFLSASNAAVPALPSRLPTTSLSL